MNNEKMKNILSRWAKNRKVQVVAGIIVLLIVGGVALGKNGNGNGYQTAVVVRDVIDQVVSVSGTVEPVDDVELAFDESGIVASINVDVGDSVEAGGVIASLSNLDILADLNQAKADLAAAQAQLEEYLFGTREEELRVQEVAVANAEAGVEDAEALLRDALKDARIIAEDAVLSKTDRFFENPRSSADVLVGSGSSAKNAVSDLRDEVEDIFDTWDNISLSGIANSELATFTDQALTDLGVIEDMLDGLAGLYSTEEPDSTQTQAQIDANTNLILSAQTAVTGAINEVTRDEDTLTSAHSALRVAEEELTVLLAGTRSETVARQQAAVDARKAQVLRRQAELEKTILRSPISGVVTRRDVDEGEGVQAQKSVFKVISAGQLQIDADVSELDVAFVAEGDVAQVTLDAYGDAVEFEAIITHVDPAETLVDNLPTYGIELVFEGEDARIRPGMTANIKIATGKGDSALLIPLGALVIEGDSTIVNVKTENGEERRDVVTGILGSSGLIEIRSGLEEGETIVYR